ncbi:nitric-oxide reductase large subunit [Kingella negevensis]|uniref:nitric-oxide reductase large subunit n=1 Tax=Kingella negevensis TaxID=1522312 RepID=UPI00050A1AC3|nr:nitric-oxide reductase large subunit [Kingella negevensis]MDK4688812.1 nitric-oxide reductase large subunit [Kingella negevensis]WII90064.1 nitric-oxide reductase large subunit [Kingella negevensis]
MGEYKKLWYALISVLIVTFSLLGYLGTEVYRQAPPFPEKYVSADGTTLFTKDDILKGQSAWQSTGGMELGSVLGHGAYQAPDWTADFLHRELVVWLDLTAQKEHGKKFDELTFDQKAVISARLKDEYRNQSAVDGNGVVKLSDTRAKAIEQVSQYYIDLYGDKPELDKSRESFAMKTNTLPDLEARKHLTQFFFWTAWTASANRPDSIATYTNNWPHEPLIDNVPTAENYMWSFASFVFLLMGIGFLVWGYHFLRTHNDEPKVPETDPLAKIVLTDSQKALWKYAALTVILFIVQILLGGLVAHYTVEGQTFYGIELSKLLPYSLARTWHLQSALFWIATGFLTAGLFIAPVLNGGKDPKFQALGVNLLYVALFIVVAGSYAGNFVSLVLNKLSDSANFWFGHQGYEYLDLGRFWQLLLTVGFLLWLFLMLRCAVPAFRQGGDKNLLTIFVASIVGVGAFYAPGLFYGEHTTLAVMEYWRWWVVHLWVEGFFEVFATAALAFIFYNLGLVSYKSATTASLVAGSLFLVGGVPGTFHHLYFTGTTTPVMAAGASFSALEVVPLILLGHEAYEHWSYQHKAPWMQRLRWPLMCFTAVAFWNMLGAGVFGFLINPPINLYYLQGLNTSAVHAHAALFGVYGFLALGFVLLVGCYIKPGFTYDSKQMTYGFWMMNAGLTLMIVSSLLPIGIFQAYASITQGLWYARSEEFLQQGYLEMFRWIRTIADFIFIGGALLFANQVIRMSISKDKQ